MQGAALRAQGVRHLRLPRGIHQFGADGHVAELSVHHLLFGVGQAVLLFDGLVAGEDIYEYQTHNQSDKRILCAETLAAKQVAVQQ